MKQKETWKQQTPRDQAIVILMSLEGMISNHIEFGWKLDSKQLSDKFADLHDIVRELSSGEWET